MNKTAEFIVQSLMCSNRSCLCSRGMSGKGNVHCPAHDDKNPSCSVRQDNSTVLVHCHAGCSQEAVIAELVKLGVWPVADKEISSQAQSRRREWAAYDAVSGEHVSNHVRIDREGKKKQLLWEPRGVSTPSMALYRVDRLHENPDCPVIICEGEPATDALATQENQLGIVAVGTVTGAGSTPGEDALRPLAIQDVYLWPDNDAKGIRHMERVGATLANLECTSIYVIDWAASSPKGDAADAISQGIDLSLIHI